MKLKTKGRITVTEAAKRAGISRGWVRMLCLRHNIGSNEQGCLRLLSSADFRRLVKAAASTTIGRPKKSSK